MKLARIAVVLAALAVLLYAASVALGLPPQAPVPPQAPAPPAAASGLTAPEAAAFRAVAADARAGRYAGEDPLWDDLRRRTGGSYAAVGVRNELARRANTGRLPSLMAWAAAIEELAGASAGGPDNGCSCGWTFKCTCSPGECQCRYGKPCKYAEAPGPSARPDGLGFCSDACRCGCREGAPCVCGAGTTRESPAYQIAPRTQPYVLPAGDYAAQPAFGGGCAGGSCGGAPARGGLFRRR